MGRRTGCLADPSDLVRCRQCQQLSGRRNRDRVLLAPPGVLGQASPSAGCRRRSQRRHVARDIVSRTASLRRCSVRQARDRTLLLYSTLGKGSPAGWPAVCGVN